MTLICAKFGADLILIMLQTVKQSGPIFCATLHMYINPSIYRPTVITSSVLATLTKQQLQQRRKIQQN